AHQATSQRLRRLSKASMHDPPTAGSVVPCDCGQVLIAGHGCNGSISGINTYTGSLKLDGAGATNVPKYGVSCICPSAGVHKFRTSTMTRDTPGASCRSADCS